MTQPHVDFGVPTMGTVAPDREPGECRPGPLLLMIGDGYAAAADHAASVAGFRVERRTGIGADMAALGLQGHAAVLWVADAGQLDPAADAALAAFVEAQRAGLVLVTHRADIDHAYALESARLASDILVDPGSAEAALAMTRALRPFGKTVHDGDERPPTIDRLDQLQDEVARIASVLARLSLDDANRVAGGSDYIGYAASPDPYVTGGSWPNTVSAPTRGYGAAAMPGAFPSGLSHAEQRVRQVRTIIRLRRARDAVFPTDLFADPAWDMLLDLYAARLEGKTVSVSSLCIAAAVPATTALRWIRSMTDAGLFLREADGNDRRRVFIALSDRAEEALDRYFTSIGDALPV